MKPYLLKTIALFGFLGLFIFPILSNAQARLAFHNTENLFDIEKDTLSHNNETQNTELYRNEFRYKKKLMMLYKTYVSMQNHQPLALIGLAEIENKKVLQDLLSKTPMVNLNYKIIHNESRDHRGIDVAILYDENQYYPIFSKPIQVINPTDSGFRTRDILYSKGMLLKDTLHIFVNHWPSSYSGLMKNRPKRLLAAQILKSNIDSILKINPNANIVVMGDFNEPPSAPGIQFLIHGVQQLYTLKGVSTFKNVTGTIKHNSVWQVYDEVIVSNSLITGSNGMFAKDKSFFIFDVGFLLEKDKKYTGWKTFRTYQGLKYNGGISDHLPVYIDLTSTK
ncbi:MAG: hypothetical protein JXR65_08195 [Bacteroidales bacterium]|nr:hypothetical protein [Bacteroidales bacterium]